MFIHSLQLKSFKGFSAEPTTIIFNKPNGDLGSGLNIFIGENNCGKSTILEAIDFLRDGSKKPHEILKFKDENGAQNEHAEVEIVFEGDIENTVNTFAQAKKIEVFISRIYQCDDLRNHLKLRRTTEKQSTIELWSKDSSIFENVSGIDAPIKRMFETNFIWADTDPNDQVSFGASTLCGLLLKEIAESHKGTNEYKDFQKKFNDVFNDENSELRVKLAEIEDQIGSLVNTQFGSASIKFGFEEPNIQSFFKNTAVLVDDGINVPMAEKGNGMQRAIALALLQVYAKTVAYDSAQAKSKPFYFFIDEPELCLHPKGQQKLLDALLEISKVRQVFVTTHSPYFLNTCHLKNVGIHIFKKNGYKNEVIPASVDYLFPWSPTWGEINYRAYNLATVDFHNELFGYIQDSIANKTTLKTFDQWLDQHYSIPKNKKWSKDGEIFEDVTLMHFIRNHIHHPENVHMKSNYYEQDDLENSIDEMIKIIEVFEAQKKLAAVS